MAAVVIMPKLGLTMKNGTVAQWKVLEGARVTAGAVIVEIMTEKITSQVEAPASGILLKIVVGKGVKVPIGATLAVIGAEGEDIAELLLASPNGHAGFDGGTARVAAAGGRAPTGGKVIASPAARKLADELGIDLSRVAGTGPGGRITKEDVEAWEDEAGDDEGKVIRELVDYAGMRRAIGENMAMSWTVAPTVTQQVRVEVSALQEFRAALNRGKREKDKVSVTAVLVKAVAVALERMPRMNATLDGDQIKVWQDINIGVAMALPDGLIVPVVKSANTKGFQQIAAEIRDFGLRAKRLRLSPDDVAGGTFTITNVGGYGSVDWFTPIINQPESAILGVGRIVDDVVAFNGQPVVRPTMGLSLSFDHRVIDGAPAAQYLRILLDMIANPMGLIA